MNATVSWAGLALSLLLVAVAAAVSWWQRLGLQRQILVAATRALAQLLLVGAAPVQAVLVQAVVMFLVLAATATTTVVIALGLIRRLFTPDHRLIHLPAPADH